MPRTKKVGRGVRTQAIREYMDAHPEATAGEIVEALRAQGLKVNAGMVYNLRSSAKRTGKRGRPAKRGVNGVSRRGRPASGTTLSEKQLLATKQLADQLGGTDALRRTLDLLEKLAR